MLVDARDVDGVQLFNIAPKMPASPQVFPFLILQELPDKASLWLVGNIPEDLRATTVIFEHDFRLSISKWDRQKPTIWQRYGRDQYAKLYKTIYRTQGWCPLQTQDLAAYLKIQQILLIKMIQIFKSWALWPWKWHHEG